MCKLRFLSVLLVFACAPMMAEANEQNNEQNFAPDAYIYGAAGTARYDVNPQTLAHYGDAADASDVVIAGGFGLRLNSAWQLELGITDIGTPYKQKRYWPQPEGNMATQQGQTLAHEISMQRQFQPNMMMPIHITARLGWAMIDSETGDYAAPFWGFGGQFNPLRVEYRRYRFDDFSANVVLFSYIYDF